MAINLKNYTTVVPAAKSIEQIEKMLVEFGAFNIMKEYQEFPGLPGRRCMQIAFIIAVTHGETELRMPFRLAGNPLKVAVWLGKKRPAMSERSRAEQAERIAWKQQAEILHLQLGQIEMTQLEVLQVLLPYSYDIERNQTLYEKMKAGGFKQLTNG